MSTRSRTDDAKIPLPPSFFLQILLLPSTGQDEDTLAEASYNRS